MGDELRSDIRAARDGMAARGARRETVALAGCLDADETVSLLATATYGSLSGLLALTDRRLLFLKQPRRGTPTTASFALEATSSVQWSTGVLTGTITVLSSGSRAELTWVDRIDGKKIADAMHDLREPPGGRRAADGPSSQSTTFAGQAGPQAQGEEFGCLAVLGLLVAAGLAVWAVASHSLWIGLVAFVVGGIGTVGATIAWARAQRSRPAAPGIDYDSPPRPVAAIMVGVLGLAAGSVAIGQAGWYRWVTCDLEPAADLTGCELAGRNLSGTDLTGANLSGLDLTGTDLSGAVLDQADLTGTTMTDTVLSSARLSGADLAGLDLTPATVDGVTFSGADLTGADLSGHALGGADLSGSTAVDASLARSDLTGANLADADLSDADLSGATLAGSDLTGTNLAGADLQGVSLARVDLAGHDLSGFDLSGADLEEADLTGATLDEADLSSARLVSALLPGANLAAANLPGVDLSGADLAGTNLDDADLSGADLSGANLTGADLRSADLTGANLAEATVGSILLEGADLEDATGLSDGDLAAGLGIPIEELASRLVDDGQRLESRKVAVGQLGAACTSDTLDTFDRVDYPVVDTVAVLNGAGSQIDQRAGVISSELGLTFPPAARMATLVVCIPAPEDILVETCEYSPTGYPPFTNFVERYRRQVTVTVIDLRGSDPRIRQVEVRGGTASACPDVELFDFGSTTERYTGDDPADVDIATAIQDVL